MQIQDQITVKSRNGYHGIFAKWDNESWDVVISRINKSLQDFYAVIPHWTVFVKCGLRQGTTLFLSNKTKEAVIYWLIRKLGVSCFCACRCPNCVYHHEDAQIIEEVHWRTGKVLKTRVG